jgi:hypothetical protein
MLALAILASLSCTPLAPGQRAASPAATPASAGPAPLASTPAQGPTPGVSVSSKPETTPGATSTPEPTPASSSTPAASDTPEPDPFVPAPSVAPSPAVLSTSVDERPWVDLLAADLPDLVNQAAVDLNRRADAPITQAIGFNVPSSHAPVGFVWNGGDRDTDDWLPQGIGGYEAAGRRWLVVSWYAKANPEDAADLPSYRGARISLVDVTDPAHPAYRHVLLVQDVANAKDKALFRLNAAGKAAYTQGERFAPIPIHAGGVEVYQRWLYVVDTQLGVRQFDLERLFTAEADAAKNRCGVIDGHAYAFDYRYVLPEVAHYQLDGAAPYSCLALEPGTTTLWLGQYLAQEDAERSAVTGFPLRPDGTLGEASSAQAFPRDSDGGYAHRIQGVYRQGRRTWLSVTGQSSYQGSTARLVMYEDGAAAGQRWRWPMAAEDLYYDAGRDTLWCLTEAAKSELQRRDRCVFGVKLGSYASP